MEIVTISVTTASKKNSETLMILILCSSGHAVVDITVNDIS